MSANCATWTSERIELLKRYLHAGLSCGQIAREIGVTRNAVVGKRNRLGLSRPKDVIGRQLEERRAARLAHPKTRRTWCPNRPRLNIFAQHERLMAAFPSPQPTAEDVPIYNGRGCTLLELSQGKCRWPISSPDADDFCFCGNEAAKRLPYCLGTRALRIGRSAGHQRGCVSIPPQPRSPAAAAFASAREHRRLAQKRVVVDLLNEEIRYIGARNEPACPAARIDQRAIGVRLRPIG
jgi:GcrA cell cycle regulator